MTLQRTYAAGVELSLETPVGKANLHVDLAPVRRPGLDKDGELKFACPDPKHPKPIGVTQQYVCTDGHIHREHELGRMRIVDDETVVPVDLEEAQAVRCGPIDKATMTLTVHPAYEVESVTTPDAAAYRCRLGKKASANQAESYAVLLAQAADPNKAIVGTLRLRDSRNFFRLVAHRGQLTLVSLVLPQDLAETDEIELPTIAPARLKAAQAALDLMMTPFDPDAYYHDVAAAMDALVATKKPNAPVLVPAASAPADDNNIIAAMEAMLAQGKVATPSRKARKAAPAKRAARPAAKKKAS